MGNRAVITTPEKKTSIYLHWNGGRDSVEALLEYCKAVGFRSPKEDVSYGLARLTQVVTNYQGSNLISVGIGDYDELDTNNGDNGVYIIDGWDIVGREFFCGEEENYNSLENLLAKINEKQTIEIQKIYEKNKKEVE